MRNVRALAIAQQEIQQATREEDILFGIRQFRNRVISSAQITHADMERKLQKVRINEIMVKHLPPIVPGPLEERELTAPHTFLSKDRHSSTTPEELS